MKEKIQMIQDVVAEYFGLSVDEMKQKINMTEIVVPRQISIYFCRYLLPTILVTNRLIGTMHNVKPETVLSSYSKINMYRKVDNNFKQILVEVAAKIKERELKTL